MHTWHASLNEAVRRNELDITNPSHLAKVECKQFRGYDSEDMDVYEFLDDLEYTIGQDTTDRIAAKLLYTKYLHKDVKDMVKNYSTDYAAMKEKLILEYGEPIKIIKSRLKQLMETKTTYTGDRALVDFWAKLARAMESLQNTITKHGTFTKAYTIT